jgi:NitT/TauT family transport system ATP-binding protein
MPDEAGVLLELRRVSKRFPAPDGGAITVLDSIDLAVHAGEFVALLGRSGSGKSTLLRLMSGLARPSGGSVLYRGRAVDEPQPGISMVFQSDALFPWLSVQQNVALGLEAQGVPEAERKARVLSAIDMIGLDGFESAYPRELSGGMRQRVGYARALVVNPDVLLMDEPFSALDVPTAESLRGDLLDLWLARKIPTRAIVLVTHNIEEAVVLADRIVVLDNNPGRIKATIPVTLRHPRDRESEAFRALVDRIYVAMSNRGAIGRRAFGIADRLPTATVEQMLGVLDDLDQPERGEGVELAELASDMQMEADDLFPILEALELLDFARPSGERFEPTRVGRAFIEADILGRKVIFGRQLLQRVPLAAHIRRGLDERARQHAPRSRFQRELEDSLTEDEADRVLDTVIDWGRYAEILAYDDGSGELSYENPGAAEP